MPVYCYTKNGETIEKVFPMGKAPKTVKVDGKTFDRDIVAEHADTHHAPGNWPRWSDALGCHPDQRGEMTKAYKKCGVDVTYNEQGQMKVESQGHENAVCRAGGFHQRNASYSQVPPKNA